MIFTSNNAAWNLEKIVLDEVEPYQVTPLVHEMIKFLLKGVYEGLILIDKEGSIQFMDKSSEKFFGLKRGEAKNLHIADLVPDTKLHVVANTGIPGIGQIQEVKGLKRIVSRLPIKKNGEIIGAIGKVLFHKIEEIEKLNSQIENLKIKINNYRRRIKKTDSSLYTFQDLLGTSDKFLNAKKMAMRVAQTDANVLLEGESGVGKELFAHSIHNISTRRNGPFIEVNCPSIPFELAESELFGYETGAFSGARREGKPGKFELSDGGTVFLDEVGSLPLSIQAKLLRVLQEREIERLGGKRRVKVDFRLISATNVNLNELVRKGQFRADLFYRISTVPIKIPPLRERKEDIPVYIEHFLKEINKRLGTNVQKITDESLQVTMNYSWPGNIRELTNVLEQSILNDIQCQKILPENLPTYVLKNTNYLGYQEINSLKSILEEAERQVIKSTLKFTRGNKRKAAKILQIQRCTLYQKLKKYPDLIGMSSVL
jgi:transcriptional regulator with PAS, ATPase and Fis domain